jgi:hypothetical protein
VRARRNGLLVAAMLVLVAALASATARADAQARAKGVDKSFSELAQDVVRAMTDYQNALQRSLPAYEAALDEATRVLNERRELQRAGHLDAASVQEAERVWLAARKNLVDHRAAMAEAASILFTASLHERLSSLAPLPRNRYEDAQGFVRFNGQTPWSLRNLRTISLAFEKKFGRDLSVSALGQTALHTRLGLDHRNAVDVAVHPDSAEGRWLMAFLREAGIPFLGVRDSVPGSATGPHIHIGPPSLRSLPR